MKNIDFQILESMLNSGTDEAVAGIIAFSKYISTTPLKDTNVHIFIKILGKNLSEAADNIFKRRSPETFFTILTISENLINSAFTVLSQYRKNELYIPILLSFLGIIQTAYKHPADGIRIYNPKVSEIYHIAKYLLQNEEKPEEMIIDILEKLGSLPSEKDASIISRKMLDTWFDKSKNLEKVIPSTIIV